MTTRTGVPGVAAREIFGARRARAAARRTFCKNLELRNIDVLSLDRALSRGRAAMAMMAGPGTNLAQSCPIYLLLYRTFFLFDDVTLVREWPLLVQQDLFF